MFSQTEGKLNLTTGEQETTS